MTCYTNKMSNAIFLLLLVECILAKDVANLKPNNFLVIEHQIIPSDNFNPSYDDNQTKDMNISQHNTHSKFNMINTVDDAQNKLIDKKKIKDDSSPVVQFREILNSGRIFLMGSSDELLQSDSSLETFYFRVFPYIKLLSFIILIIVICYIGKNILAFCFGLSKNKLEKDANHNNSLRSNDAKFTLNVPDDQDIPHDNAAFKLKGRKKRIPKPINYNELFKSNDKDAVKQKDQTNIKKINSNNDQIQNKIQNHHNQVVTSIDELFDRYIPTDNHLVHNLKADVDSVVFDNPNLILFEEHNSNHTETKQTELPIHDKLEEIKDERSKLRTRLIQGNFIEKTAITNFIDKQKV